MLQLGITAALSVSKHPFGDLGILISIWHWATSEGQAAKWEFISFMETTASILVARDSSTESDKA